MLNSAPPCLIKQKKKKNQNQKKEKKQLSIKQKKFPMLFPIPFPTIDHRSSGFPNPLPFPSHPISPSESHHVLINSS